jgi:hypothetical protein
MMISQIYGDALPIASIHSASERALCAQKLVTALPATAVEVAPKKG